MVPRQPSCFRCAARSHNQEHTLDATWAKAVQQYSYWNLSARENEKIDRRQQAKVGRIEPQFS